MVLAVILGGFQCARFVGQQLKASQKEAAAQRNQEIKQEQLSEGPEVLTGRKLHTSPTGEEKAAAAKVREDLMKACRLPKGEEMSAFIEWIKAGAEPVDPRPFERTDYLQSAASLYWDFQEKSPKRGLLELHSPAFRLQMARMLEAWRQADDFLAAGNLFHFWTQSREIEKVQKMPGQPFAPPWGHALLDLASEQGMRGFGAEYGPKSSKETAPESGTTNTSNP